jgi:hypothetical protein
MTMTTKDRTAEVLVSMLRERTGVSFLDSGGTPRYDADGHYVGSASGYGRNYERNAARDFEAEPEATVEFHATRRAMYKPGALERAGEEPCLDIAFSLSTYHFLREALAFDAAWDDFFQEWRENETELFHAGEVWDCGVAPKNRAESYNRVDMEDFWPWLRAVGFEVGGVYGDGDPFVVNTYDGECALDQTLQFLYMAVGSVPERYAERLDCGMVILLQIHQGCDVRGGYTNPRAFIAPAGEGEYVLYVADGSLVCERNPEHNWRTDDDYNWYYDGSTVRVGCRDMNLHRLPGYAIAEFEKGGDSEERYLAWRAEHGLDKLEPVPDEQAAWLPGRNEEVNAQAGKGIVDYIIEELGGVPVDAAGNGYCPLCGGKLLPYR